MWVERCLSNVEPPGSERRQIVVKRVCLLALAAVAVVTAACDDDGGITDDDSQASSTVAVVTTPSESSRPPGPPSTEVPLSPPSAPSDSPQPTLPPQVVEAPAIRTAVADLATRVGIDPEAIDVLEVREVTWPDGSLGCPEPGVGYTQALVNGQLVVLGAAGSRYEYHSGPNRPLFYCANPTAPAAPGGGSGDT